MGKTYHQNKSAMLIKVYLPLCASFLACIHSHYFLTRVVVLISKVVLIFLDLEHFKIAFCFLLFFKTMCFLSTTLQCSY